MKKVNNYQIKTKLNSKIICFEQNNKNDNFYLRFVFDFSSLMNYIIYNLNQYYN